MFGLFKKKVNHVKEAIKRDGKQGAARGFSREIIARCESREVAYQLILEELDAARAGNDTARAFAKNSGINESEYIGAMSRSCEAVDGSDGPQQLLLFICMHLEDRVSAMVSFRVAIAEEIMKYFNFGKYASEVGDAQGKTLSELVARVNVSEYGAFLEMNNDLAGAVENKPELPPEALMAYGYARRFAAAGMFVQGLLDAEQVGYVLSIFKSLQQTTGITKEFQNNAAQEALEFINTYFDKVVVSLNDVGALCGAVESGAVQPVDTGTILDPSEIMMKLKYGRRE